MALLAREMVGLEVQSVNKPESVWRIWQWRSSVQRFWDESLHLLLKVYGIRFLATTSFGNIVTIHLNECPLPISKIICEVRQLLYQNLKRRVLLEASFMSKFFCKLQEKVRRFHARTIPGVLECHQHKAKIGTKSYNLHFFSMIFFALKAMYKFKCTIRRLWHEVFYMVEDGAKRTA